MKTVTKILIADDDVNVLKSASAFLEKHGFGVIAAKDGSSAYLIAQEASPALILADVEMPGMDGHQLCRILKKDPRTRGIPVVLMSGAWVEDSDQISGLDGGADDYVIKPFSLRVLLARIQAVLRRFQTRVESTEMLESCGLKLEVAARKVTISGRQVHLTRKEFDLLLLLMQKAGRVLKPGYLLEAVWGHDLSDYNDPRTVAVHVYSLRKKLGPKVCRQLVNVSGCGYRFEKNGHLNE